MLAPKVANIDAVATVASTKFWRGTVRFRTLIISENKYLSRPGPFSWVIIYFNMFNIFYFLGVIKGPAVSIVGSTSNGPQADRRTRRAVGSSLGFDHSKPQIG